MPGSATPQPDKPHELKRPDEPYERDEPDPTLPRTRGFVLASLREVVGVKEYSFLIGNCPGAIAEIASALGSEHVNIEGIAGLTVLEEGVISLITDDPGTTRKKLRDLEIDFEEREAIVLDLPSHPGELATLLGRLKEEHINVLSIYAAAEKNKLVFTVDNLDRTKEILRIE